MVELRRRGPMPRRSGDADADRGARTIPRLRGPPAAGSPASCPAGHQHARRIRPGRRALAAFVEGLVARLPTDSPAPAAPSAASDVDRAVRRCRRRRPSRARICATPRRERAGPAISPTPGRRRRPRRGSARRRRRTLRPTRASTVVVHDEHWLADARLRRRARGRGGVGRPAAADRGPLAPARARGRRPRRAGRQGHHLRHRRAQPQDRQRR